MKFFNTILILLFFNYSFGQNSLELTFNRELEFVDHFDYHVYKEDSLIYKHCTFDYAISILSNLEKGKYEIFFSTIFGNESTEVEFKNDSEKISKYIDTEFIANGKLENTLSKIETLRENEIVVISYKLFHCFGSVENKILLTKINDYYYKIENDYQERISKRRIEKIIDFEKKFRNLNFEGLDNVVSLSTCTETISFIFNKEETLSKKINCGNWKQSSEIEELIR